MDKLDRIYALHTELANARLPVSKKTLEEKLECTHATVERIIRDMRLYLNAPIEYDRTANGYYYDSKINPNYELPGLWFNPTELHALLTAYHLLTNVEPGLLETHIAPLKNKIQKLLHNDKAGDKNLGNRIRIVKIASRRHNPKHFSAVASALINRQQLYIRYLGRERNKESERTVSPQRIIYYRDNWYLDAWCHKREALRNFSIDRILESKAQNLPAKDISTTRPALCQRLRHLCRRTQTHRRNKIQQQHRPLGRRRTVAPAPKRPVRTGRQLHPGNSL